VTPPGRAAGPAAGRDPDSESALTTRADRVVPSHCDYGPGVTIIMNAALPGRGTGVVSGRAAAAGPRRQNKIINLCNKTIIMN
jgi:hypothetical protein